MSLFLLVALQRSGTNLLRSVLDRHPDIHCHPEMFIEYTREMDGTFFFNYLLARIAADPDAVLPRTRNDTMRAYLRDVLLAGRIEGHVGIDIKYNQWEIPFVGNFFSAIKPPVIHLVRRNALRIYLSTFLKWHTAGDQTPENIRRQFPSAALTAPHRVRLTPDARLLGALADTTRRQAAMSHTLRRTMHTLEISYEAMTENRGEVATLNPTVLGAIYDFLGVKDRDVEMRSPLGKTNPHDLEALIENYAEVADALRKNGMEGFLS